MQKIGKNVKSMGILDVLVIFKNNSVLTRINEDFNQEYNSLCWRKL